MTRVTWLLAFSFIVACGGNGSEDTDSTPGPIPPDEEPNEPGGPEFLSFGTSGTALTEGESVVFSAVLTDPDGIDNVIGGTLQNPDGTVQYGSFATSGQEGSYSLSLSWAQLHQAQAIEFEGSDTRQFVAVFFDAEGHKSQRQVSITLECDDDLACDGECTSPFYAESCGGCGNVCGNGYYDQHCGGPGVGCIEVRSSNSPATCADVCAAEGESCINADFCVNAFDYYDSNAASYSCANIQVDIGCNQMPADSVPGPVEDCSPVDSYEFYDMDCCCGAP